MHYKPGVLSPNTPLSKAPDSRDLSVLERLVAGPVSTLYLARQTSLDRLVWLKKLNDGILPSSPLARVVFTEARTLAILNHPNIIQVHELVASEDSVGIVLEYLDGLTLDALLERGKRLETDAAVAIALQIARALSHCADRNIVHQDVGPRNVWLTLDGRVKLIGFGSASLAVGASAAGASAAGALSSGALSNGALSNGASAAETAPADASLEPSRYLSPEQILGEVAQPASDLFSLGTLLYEMLAGHHPFAQGGERSFAQRIRHDQPPLLGSVQHSIRPELERIVRRCLEKFPADRFFSAVELSSSLAAELAPAGRSSNQIVRGELWRLGFRESSVVEPVDSVAPGRSPSRSRGLTQRAALYFGGCFTLLVAGFSTIELAHRSTEQASPSEPAKLELVPEERGWLRVVASPWAHVIVDGVEVETTPFAQPVPLSPGAHDIRLRHPRAREERRLIKIDPGKTVLVEVKFQLDVPPPAPQQTPARTPAADAGP